MGLKQMFGRGGQTETEPENALSTELREHHEQAVDQAWRDMREILNRLDDPGPEDRARITEILETLQRGPEYLEYFKAVIDEARRVQGIAETAPVLEKRLERMKAKRAEQCKEVDRLRAVLNDGYAELQALEQSARDAHEQILRIKVLQSQYPDLLADYPRGVPRTAVDKWFGAIEKVASRLGIITPARQSERGSGRVMTLARQ